MLTGGGKHFLSLPNPRGEIGAGAVWLEGLVPSRELTPQKLS
jgi:hypothetical protein